MTMSRKVLPEGELKVAQRPDEANSLALARVALDPVAGAAAVANAFSKPLFGKTEVTDSYEVLVERALAVRGNKLASVEDMLTAQAAALNAIFLELARRSGANLGEYIDTADRYMRLALKAQGQCRATLETLAAIKNPPVVYAKQANIAAGPQQVNNGPAPLARAADEKVSPNKLLENSHVEWLDGGAAGTPVGSDQELETVGAIDRPALAPRKSSRQPKR
jgi:orotate phosphoribosyltransferase